MIVVMTSFTPRTIFISVGGIAQRAPPTNAKMKANGIRTAGGNEAAKVKPNHVANIDPKTNCPCPPMFQKPPMYGISRPIPMIIRGVAMFRVEARL